MKARGRELPPQTDQKRTAAIDLLRGVWPAQQPERRDLFQGLPVCPRAPGGAERPQQPEAPARQTLIMYARSLAPARSCLGAVFSASFLNAIFVASMVITSHFCHTP
ncbi:hypothetical protein NDU88_001404 [Pleurodeles waltl]|uniref:Uncharacterized protein n=1 Tax=Pleurodeles waltl TaxID=8319 RepID=A0AAV7T015_PLEWA|nr:hypothetical protein NDU88_001404 [Pleurodeles waltl]